MARTPAEGAHSSLRVVPQHTAVPARVSPHACVLPSAICLSGASGTFFIRLLFGYPQHTVFPVLVSAQAFRAPTETCENVPGGGVVLPHWASPQQRMLPPASTAHAKSYFRLRSVNVPFGGAMTELTAAPQQRSPPVGVRPHHTPSPPEIRLNVPVGAFPPPQHRTRCDEVSALGPPTPDSIPANYPPTAGETRRHPVPAALRAMEQLT